MRRRNKPKQPLPTRAELIMGLLACLLMGTVFTFGVSYWSKEITRDEAVYKRLICTGYRVNRTNKTSTRITLYFSDHKPLEIHRTMQTDALENALDGPHMGTQLEMEVYSHPNSSTIMELTFKGKTWFTFEEMIQEINRFFQMLINASFCSIVIWNFHI